jgi:hypothetical protein
MLEIGYSTGEVSCAANREPHLVIREEFMSSHRHTTMPQTAREADTVTRIRSWTLTRVIGTAVVLLNQALILATGISRH